MRTHQAGEQAFAVPRQSAVGSVARRASSVAGGPSRRGFSAQSGARQVIRGSAHGSRFTKEDLGSAHRSVEQVLPNRCQRRVFHHLDLVLRKERTSIRNEDVGISKVDVP